MPNIFLSLSNIYVCLILRIKEGYGVQFVTGGWEARIHIMNLKVSFSRLRNGHEEYRSARQKLLEELRRKLFSPD